MIKINLLQKLFSNRQIAEIIGTSRQNLEKKSHIKAKKDIKAVSKAIEWRYKDIQLTVKELRRDTKKALQDDSS